MMNETITISLKKYKRLVKDSEWLQALECAGVDSWDGCDWAYEELKTIRKRKNDSLESEH
jgi:hypothetical protein